MHRGRRMAAEDVEGLVDLGNAAALDLMTEEGLVAVVVACRIEFERALADQLGLQLGLQLRILRLEVDADAGEDPRQRLDIGLGIAGADAHGVELHDLAGVVLVEMAGRVVGVVEVTQHHRMMQGRRQQVTELAERVGTDRAIFVVADQHADVGLVLVDVEVVEPEPGQAFAQLIRRIQRVQDAARRGLPGAVVHGLLIDLLRRLLLLGISDLVGGLALLIERHRDVEWKAMHVRHRLDLGMNGGRQRGVGRLQLLLQPAFDADLAQMRRARRVDAPGQAIEQRDVLRGKFGRPRRLVQRHQPRDRADHEFRDRSRSEYGRDAHEG